MDEPAAGSDDVLARRKQVADVGEAAGCIGLHLAHVEHHIGVGMNRRIAFVGRDDAGVGDPAQRARIDTRLSRVVHPHADEFEVRPANHVTQGHRSGDPGRPLDDACHRRLSSIPHHVEARR